MRLSLCPGLSDAPPGVQSIVKDLRLHGAAHGAMSSFHHLFWMGDLNYRVNFGGANDFKDGKPSAGLSEAFQAELTRSRLTRNYQQLMSNDQLQLVQAQGAAFVDFREGVINFPPTFKVRQHLGPVWHTAS
jgi:hypothetical protein